MRFTAPESGRLVALVAALLGGCERNTSATVEPNQASRQPAGSSPSMAEPLPEPGPVIEANIPLLKGGMEPLSSLRGRVVLLEVSDSTQERWVADQQRWAALLDEFGDDELAIVVVSADPLSEAPQRYWDRTHPPFVLGWDPQGALALRLGIDTLPARFVLDSQGRTLGTFHAEPDRVEALVRRAIAR